METHRVPRTINGMNQWIHRTDDRLTATNPATTQPYWKDYGLVIADSNAWHDRRLTWDGLFTKHEGPHDSTVNEDIKNFIPAMAAFAERPLGLIALSSIAGSVEESIFNFKIGHADPTVTHEVITAQVAVRIANEGRGRFDFLCTRA